MSNQEPLSQSEKAIPIEPMSGNYYIIKKSDFEELIDLTDKIAGGEELLSGGIGFLLGILGAALIFALINGDKNDMYFYAFFFALVALICLYILISIKRKEQGNALKQCLKRLSQTKGKVSQDGKN
jgi:hypothetical protein